MIARELDCTAKDEHAEVEKLCQPEQWAEQHGGQYRASKIEKAADAHVPRGIVLDGHCEAPETVCGRGVPGLLAHTAQPLGVQENRAFAEEGLFHTRCGSKFTMVPVYHGRVQIQM